jgi:hypothetical protein
MGNGGTGGFVEEYPPTIYGIMQPNALPSQAMPVAGDGKFVMAKRCETIELVVLWHNREGVALRESHRNSSGVPMTLAKYNLDASEILAFTERRFLEVCRPAHARDDDEAFRIRPCEVWRCCRRYR